MLLRFFDSINKFSIFDNKSSFSNENIRKTANDFAKNKQVQLSLGNDFTVNSYANYIGGDIWIILNGKNLLKWKQKSFHLSRFTF